jgi:peptide/nickel transport system ATP-binding protein
MAFISVRNLSITLGHGDKAQKVLDDVSFDIEQGEVFGLVGESGSGKSTILRCIAGLYHNWTGEILIDGEPLGRAITLDRCRKTQMVFQDPYGSLHPKQTVNSQLLDPIRIHKMGDDQARVIAALNQVGLPEDFRFRYPHQLSGGQRQRVATARALVMNPRIILLDEPTSALDVSVQAEILNMLQDLKSRSDLTYILVSHDLAVIAHMCSRFSVMQHGRIIETLSSDAIGDEDAETTDYTRLLIKASRAYDRDLAANS